MKNQNIVDLFFVILLFFIYFYIGVSKSPSFIGRSSWFFCCHEKRRSTNTTTPLSTCIEILGAVGMRFCVHNYFSHSLSSFST